MRSLVVGLLGVMVAACVPPPVSASPTSAATDATATRSAAATSTAAPARPTTFAFVCGTISDWLGDTSQANGSLVLSSPGRDPIKLTIPAGRLGGGAAAGYVCVGVLGGIPYPLFDGFVPGGAENFIASGTFPATLASPAPTGFVPPQACAYVAAPVVTADQTDWRLDCGAANNNARGILGQALAQQGWTSCGSGVATAQWRRNNVMLAVSESSLAPGDYPRLTQFARVTSPCS